MFCIASSISDSKFPSKLGQPWHLGDIYSLARNNYAKGRDRFLAQRGNKSRLKLGSQAKEHKEADLLISGVS